MAELHASHYADQLHIADVPILLNEQIAESTYRLRVCAPQIASGVTAGQFVMIRMSGLDAPLIGRALAVYNVSGNASGTASDLDLVYLRKGTFTRVLAAAHPETRVSIWGPLGNAFRTTPCRRLLMAVGGIGQTPMLLLGRDALGHHRTPQPWAERVELIYGARRHSLLAGVDDFHRAGFDVTLCTDDGSMGTHELVPDALARRLREIGSNDGIRVVTCGPEVMLERVAQVCRDAGIDCQVSMETPMACGIGVCFSCVARVRQETPSGWDYKRTCVEGPIFDAREICW